MYSPSLLCLSTAFVFFFTISLTYISLSFSFTQMRTLTVLSFYTHFRFLLSSYSTSDNLTGIFPSLISVTFFSLSCTYVTETHRYLPNLAQFGYVFNCTYYSTALPIFFLWFSFGNPRWMSTAHAHCRHREHGNCQTPWIHSADWLNTVHTQQLCMENLRFTVQIPKHQTHGICAQYDAGEK